MVVPDDHSGVRQVRLSNRMVRTGVSFGVLLFAVLVSLSAGFFVKEDQRLEANRLAKANEMLVAELDEIRTSMATLESSLAQLSQKDEQYRLLANLEPLDEEVKLAGVGGPGSRTVDGSPLWSVDKSLAELTFGTSEDMDALIRRAQVLSSSWVVAAGALILLLVAGAGLAVAGRGFLPEFNEGSLTVSAVTLPGSICRSTTAPARRKSS